MSRFRNIHLFTWLILLIITGCESDILETSPGAVESQQLEQYDRASMDNLSDVPALEVDLPVEPRAWNRDVDVLRDSIAAHDGKAMIGFKAPESERLIESGGIRAALTAAEFKSALQMIDSLDIEIESIFRSFGGASVRMDPELVLELNDHPQVDYIEIPVTYHLQSSLVEKSALMERSVLSQTTPWGIDLVRAPTAWSEATGNGVKVLVIDTGMDNHIDLPDRPTANCDGPVGGGGCSDPIDHGTHVSGSLMALDNNFGVVGVAPGLLDSEVYSFGACDAFGRCEEVDVASGIDFGVNNGVDVINMSLGFSQSHTGLANAVSAAWNAGSVLVAAAGNNQPNTVIYPAGNSQVIGVSGVKDNGFFADSSPCMTPTGPAHSNDGPHVSIAAPFWALSTVGTSDYEDEIYGWCGTSMAAPHVSGAAALLFEQNPTWSNAQVRHRLQNSANHPFDSLTSDQEYGHGVLDAGAALGFTLPINPNIDGPTQIQVNQYVEFNATVSGGVKPYSFQWQIDYSMAGSSWQNVGGDASFYGHQSFNDDDFLLRVIVTDADNDTGTSLNHWVTVTY